MGFLNYLKQKNHEKGQKTNTSTTVNWEKFSEKNLRVPSHPFYNNDDFWSGKSWFESGSPKLEERFKCKTLKEYKEKYGRKDNQEGTK